MSITSQTTPTQSESPGALTPLESTRIEATPTKPEATPTKQEATPTKQETTPSKPEATPTKPEATFTKSEATPTKPKTSQDSHSYELIYSQTQVSPHVLTNQSNDSGFKSQSDPKPIVPKQSTRQSSVSSNLNPEVREFKPTGLYDPVKPTSTGMDWSKQESLRSGDKVYVTWVSDPHNFKVILARQKLELNTLMEKMDDHFNARVSDK